MNLDSVTLERALKALGNLLADRGYYYEIVAIGGGGLLLLGQIERPTRDLDLVALIDNGRLVSATPLPHNLLQAAEEVGRAAMLEKGWLNAGPTSLLQAGLPEGFTQRMRTRHYGGLTVHLAGRFDQICFKLYASIDHGPRSKHFADLKLLQPTHQELKIAQHWCLSHDVSETFANELQNALTHLEVIDAP